MREIVFYYTLSGRSPVRDFLDDLSPQQLKKVAKQLELVGEVEMIPSHLMKKLTGTDGLWEIRIQHTGNAFRILCFWDGARIVVLVSAFAKKTTKTPALEIEVAQRRRREYLNRKERHG